MGLLSPRKRVPRRKVRILAARHKNAKHKLPPRSIHIESEPPEGEGVWSPNRMWVFSERLNKVVELQPEQFKIIGWHS